MDCDANAPADTGSRRTTRVPVCYLFWTSGEYHVQQRRARGLDAEVDLRVRAISPEKTPHPDLGTYLLVECKNTQKPSGAAVVKKLATEVRLARCRCGVLVALAGITGNTDGRDAAYTVRKLFHADGTIILVIDFACLESLVRQSRQLLDVLVERYEAIRFDARLP